MKSLTYVKCIKKMQKNQAPRTYCNPIYNICTQIDPCPALVTVLIVLAAVATIDRLTHEFRTLRTESRMGANDRRILVTGGGTFLGQNIVAALLAEGAEVTVLVRPGSEDRLGPLAARIRWHTADVWDSASLRGRARGHGTVIHTVGSMVADPAQGLTHHRLNFVSARNVVNMCVSDGVPHMILLSSPSAPWVNARYLKAKREAEDYLRRVGVKGTVIRAPLAYMPGARRPLFYALISLLGRVPPLSWTQLGRIAPLPVDVIARGVARIALETERSKTIYYAADLRRRNQRTEAALVLAPPPLDDDDTQPARRLRPFDLVDEDTPFGWSPRNGPR